ncbi:MAG: glycosyltransferase, partial [Bacteroidales bacterium]|nr:glycosyltransferase [Bacteroidales bacterium]
IAKKILPLIRKHKPDIRILISGATPDKRVRAVESKNIHVGGWVEDIRVSYARAKIFIAPMQIGTGLQNKLLEAMAMKIPCITSSLANKALEAKPMQDILIGKDPCDYADHIVSLLEDQKFANAIAENGYAFVYRHYNWQSQTDKLEQIIKSGS